MAKLRHLFVLVVLGVIGCGDEDTVSRPTGAGGNGASGGSGAQGGGDAGGGGNAGGSAGGDGGSGGAPQGTIDEFGFTRRLPVEREVTCSSYPPGFPSDPVALSDHDFLCTFAHSGVEATLYVQNTVTDCRYVMTPQGIFESRGWASSAGVITALQKVAYEWGGNHQNDSVDFTLEGTRYRYYHSSFGFGWRACQPMDCLQVVNEAGTVLEDGCEPTRSLPITCVPVESDGTAAELVDTFQTCLGDEG